MIKQDHILRFESFSKFDNLIHGFSTGFFGSLRPSHPEYNNSLKKFVRHLGISAKKIVRMNQVHSNTVYPATNKDYGKIITKTDGLITKDKNIFLGVVAADCAPILFYDPKIKIVAAVHAGWRGLFNEIIKETVVNLIAKGSDPKDIIVGVGPCIRACCYDIPKERADQIINKFPDWKPFIINRGKKLFFDLPGAASYQLQGMGIPDVNIEDANYCTFDHKDVYSYRREGENFGEIMGIIGLI